MIFVQKCHFLGQKRRFSPILAFFAPKMRDCSQFFPIGGVQAPWGRDGVSQKRWDTKFSTMCLFIFSEFSAYNGGGSTQGRKIQTIFGGISQDFSISVGGMPPPPKRRKKIKYLMNNGQTISKRLRRHKNATYSYIFAFQNIFFVNFFQNLTF